jgi:hypothetical protein
MTDEVKPTDDAKKDVKAGGKWGKYKWYIISGGVIILVLLIFFMRKGSGSGSSATTASTSNIDPATGYPYGSAADLAALGQSGTVTQPPTGSSGGSGYGSQILSELQTIQSQLPNSATSTASSQSLNVVPNVMGLTVNQAEAILTGSGFKYSMSGSPSGKISSQTPVGGYLNPTSGNANTVDIASK